MVIAIACLPIIAFIMLLRSTALLIPLLSLANAAPSRLLTSNDHSSILPIALLTILLLAALLYYDKLNGFRWLNAIRHGIGEAIRRTRRYRKKNGEKSMRVETEEVLPTPKSAQITEHDNERPFIEEAHSVLHESLTSPQADPMVEEELQEPKKEVNLKEVFQARESKAKGNGKPKKEKKSKSKLKSRLQSHGNEQEEKEGEEESSFNDEESVDEGAPRGTEVE